MPARIIDEIWSASSADEMVLEGMIDFEKEISVIVARGADGAMATFPVCENLHQNHILDRHDRARAGESRKWKATPPNSRAPLRRRSIWSGLLAVEMFLKKTGETAW